MQFFYRIFKVQVLYQTIHAMKKLFLLLLFIQAAQISLAQWEPDVRLTSDGYDSQTSMRPCIAANGDTLHAVWSDNRFGLSAIFYRRSEDSGKKWGSIMQLTAEIFDAYNPSISVSGSNVHVVWDDSRNGSGYSIYYKRSTNSGVKWSEDIKISSNYGTSHAASIALDGSDVYAVWYGQTNNNSWAIYFNHSIDNGLNWGSGLALTLDKPCCAGLASIVVSGTIIHVSWNDSRNGNWEVYYKRSIDGGLTWGEDTRMTTNSGETWCPSMALNDSIVYDVWEDDIDGNYELYYNKSEDNGSTWGDITRLTYAVGSSEYPSIVVSGDLLHVTWKDNRDGNWEVYYKQSIDGGSSWADDERLTEDEALSNYPSVAISDSAVHVIWADSRDGNSEIYYKRNLTGNIPVGVENNISGNSGEKINIYPNPLTGQVLNISVELESRSAVSVKLFSMTGEAISEKIFQGVTGKNQFIMDIPYVAPGLYLLKMQSGDEISYSRVILE
jgi:hypothetical protein